MLNYQRVPHFEHQWFFRARSESKPVGRPQLEKSIADEDFFDGYPRGWYMYITWKSICWRWYIYIYTKKSPIVRDAWLGHSYTKHSFLSNLFRETKPRNTAQDNAAGGRCLLWGHGNSMFFFFCESVRWKCGSSSQQVGVAKRCSPLGDSKSLIVMKLTRSERNQLFLLTRNTLGRYSYPPFVFQMCWSSARYNWSKGKFARNPCKVMVKNQNHNEPASKKGWQRVLNAARLKFIGFFHITRSS